MKNEESYGFTALEDEISQPAANERYGCNNLRRYPPCKVTLLIESYYISAECLNHHDIEKQQTYEPVYRINIHEISVQQIFPPMQSQKYQGKGRCVIVQIPQKGTTTVNRVNKGNRCIGAGQIIFEEKYNSGNKGEKESRESQFTPAGESFRFCFHFCYVTEKREREQGEIYPTIYVGHNIGTNENGFPKSCVKSLKLAKLI